MVKKESTEQHFKDSCLQNPNIKYITKVQVNPFAFTSTEGDFRIQTITDEVFVECKQVDVRKYIARSKEPKFQISRLSQEADLLEFESILPRNKSYIFLNYWYGDKVKSLSLLIPIKYWWEFRCNNRKIKSLDMDSAIENFNQFKVSLLKGTNKFWFIDL